MSTSYSDGHPLDDVQYLESKIILKPDRFVSVESFFDFGELVERAARSADIRFSTEGVKGLRPRIREVLFLDTADFLLYRNSFILRRRIVYEDGFPIGDPEIVFKFRHPELEKAAAVDVRPNIAAPYRIKFKVEVLPLRDRIGGYRKLYSHNCVFSMSHAQQRREGPPMAVLAYAFPALAALECKKDSEKVELVNHTAVEEVLQDLGQLDFGKGMVAKANVALWRSRGDQFPLAGEFAFQCKFKRRDEAHEKAIKRCEQLFLALQEMVRDWIALGTTKTGIVYQLKGNPPQGHE